MEHNRVMLDTKICSVGSGNPVELCKQSKCTSIEFNVFEGAVLKQQIA